MKTWQARFARVPFGSIEGAPLRSGVCVQCGKAALPAVGDSEVAELFEQDSRFLLDIVQLGRGEVAPPAADRAPERLGKRRRQRSRVEIEAFCQLAATPLGLFTKSS